MEGSHRLQIDYLDARGLPTSSSPEAAAAVLAALGDELSPPEAVLVAWDGSVAGGPAALPAGTTIVDHTGHPLDPTALPLGYHTVLRGDTAVGTVISAPTLAPATSAGRWGVAAPLYALRTDATKGIATYRDLTRLFGWLGGHGGDVVLTLPLLPLYLDEPADWSPYSAVTRRTWSELYVDYDALGAPEPLPVPPLADDGHLDHPALGRYRTARLDAISERLLADPDFVTWRSANALAETYARFRGAQAVFGRQAARWPVSRTEALAAAEPVVTRRHLVGAWLADRQLAEVAAAARVNGQTLALDVAIGSHSDGFDVWHEGDLFVHGVSVGAPPDPLFWGGQNWGFPPVHPEQSRRTGHRYFRETIRHHLRHAGLLRLDHVMGLFRQWWIPQGAAAPDGCYVRHPLDEMLAIVCLEAHVAGAVVVGENLGVVPPEVYTALPEHRLLGMRVGPDAMPTWGTDQVQVAPRGTMSMLSTHDTPPFAGWWHAADLHTNHRLGLLTDDGLAAALEERADVRARVVGHLVWTGRLPGHDEPEAAIAAGVMDELASQPADITVFNLEDFWLEDRPQNVPGTFQEEPNWRRVAALTLEQMEADPQIAATAGRIAARRHEVATQSPPH